MKENHKVSVGISPTPEIMNPQCSCSECNSASCFAKRQPVSSHSTGIFKDSKSCLSLGKNRSGPINSGNKKIEITVENVTKELVKKAIVYELDKNNKKRVVSKKKSRLFYETVNQKDNVGEDKHDLLITKDPCACSNKMNKEVNPPAANVSRKAASPSAGNSFNKEACPSSGNLSAQVIDKTYKDFHKSVCNPNFHTTLPNLSFDIFSRIKKAYKACSCKVCECLAGKSLTKDDCTNFTENKISCPKDEGYSSCGSYSHACKCDPCECLQCKPMYTQRLQTTTVVPIEKELQQRECDCVGMPPPQYNNPSCDSSHACKCEPCQCNQCKPMYTQRLKTVFVVPVGAEIQRRVCECTPCECFSCGLDTSINRHPQCHCVKCLDQTCLTGKLLCTCGRQSRVMSKQFQQDSDNHKDDHHNTITMFATIANSYPKHGTNNQQCNCGFCECLSCKYNESKKSSPEVFKPIQNNNLKNKTDNCKCLTCECQYCVQHSNIQNTSAYGSDFCNFIICKGLENSNGIESDMESDKNYTKNYHNIINKKDCSCVACECFACEKLVSTIGEIYKRSNNNIYENGNKAYSNEPMFPVKKEETPSIFRRKLKDSFIKSCVSALETNEGILKHSLLKPSAHKAVQRKVTRDDSNNDGYFQESDLKRTPHNFHYKTETMKQAQISKCVNPINIHSRSIGPSLESNFSDDSSMPFIKDARDNNLRHYEERSPLSKKNNLDSLNEDNTKAQKTLEEARAFSLHLLGLLDKYEKANKDFESVSEMFKPHVSPLQTNISQHTKRNKGLVDINEVPTKEDQQKSFGPYAEELIAIYKNDIRTDKVQLTKEFERTSENGANCSIYSKTITESETCNETNEGRDESGDNINKIKEFLNTIIEPADVSYKEDMKKMFVTKSLNKMYKHSICSNQTKSKETSSSSIKADATAGTNTDNNKVLDIKPIEQRQNKTIKQNTKDNHISETDVITIKQPMAYDNRNTFEMKGDQLWPIIKKNFCLDNTNAHKLRHRSELERDVKAATKAISKQKTNENATYIYENRALTHLHSEVRKLLEMPILKTFSSTFVGQTDSKSFMYTHNNLFKTLSSQTNRCRGKKDGHSLQKSAGIAATSSGNSCDTMKVNYLSVRRVSDHTVLVKWNTPRLLNNVEGYELLVDGRSVQKILSPSRRMAVVTCLPHIDKVLLTVRTVMRSPCPSHSPAVTIVYHSRK